MWTALKTQLYVSTRHPFSQQNAMFVQQSNGWHAGSRPRSQEIPHHFQNLYFHWCLRHHVTYSNYIPTPVDTFAHVCNESVCALCRKRYQPSERIPRWSIITGMSKLRNLDPPSRKLKTFVSTTVRVSALVLTPSVVFLCVSTRTPDSASQQVITATCPVYA